MKYSIQRRLVKGWFRTKVEYDVIKHVTEFKLCPKSEYLECNTIEVIAPNCTKQTAELIISILNS